MGIQLTSYVIRRFCFGTSQLPCQTTRSVRRGSGFVQTPLASGNPHRRKSARLDSAAAQSEKSSMRQVWTPPGVKLSCKKAKIGTESPTVREPSANVYRNYETVSSMRAEGVRLPLALVRFYNTRGQPKLSLVGPAAEPSHTAAVGSMVRLKWLPGVY